MHEHVFVLDPEAMENYGRVWGAPIWDEEVRVADAIAKLHRLRDGGIETIVDPTVYGLGRNIARLQRINAEVDLNIVVATGVYAFLELRGFLGYRTDDQLVELFVRELREGIDDTGVSAAFLKCAVEQHGLVGDVPRILALVAAAAVETGAPVMVHTSAPAQTGIPALETLTAAGVDPRRIVIAHAGDSNDLVYLRALADAGAWLGCDRFNIEHFNPEAKRIETLLALLARGVRRQHPPRPRRSVLHGLHGAQPAVRERDPDYLHISRNVLPVLLEAGIPQEQIDRMLVENPKRFFASPTSCSVLIARPRGYSVSSHGHPRCRAAREARRGPAECACVVVDVERARPTPASDHPRRASSA